MSNISSTKFHYSHPYKKRPSSWSPPCTTKYMKMEKSRKPTCAEYIEYWTEHQPLFVMIVILMKILLTFSLLHKFYLSAFIIVISNYY